MAKIHGLIFIISGLVMSIISLNVKYEKLYLFFYIGILFIIMGTAKMIYNAVQAKQKKAPIANHRRLGQQGSVNQYTQNQLKNCQRCGNISRIHHNFCSRCGARF